MSISCSRFFLTISESWRLRPNAKQCQAPNIHLPFEGSSLFSDKWSGGVSPTPSTSGVPWLFVLTLSKVLLQSPLLGFLVMEPVHRSVGFNYTNSIIQKETRQSCFLDAQEFALFCYSKPKPGSHTATLPKSRIILNNKQIKFWFRASFLTDFVLGLPS